MMRLLELLKFEGGSAKLHSVKKQDGSLCRGLVDKYDLVRKEGVSAKGVLDAAMALSSVEYVEAYNLMGQKITDVSSTNSMEQHSIRLTDKGWGIANALPKLEMTDDVDWNNQFWQLSDVKRFKGFVSALVRSEETGFDAWSKSNPVLGEFVSTTDVFGRKTAAISEEAKEMLVLMECAKLVVSGENWVKGQVPAIGISPRINLTVYGNNFAKAIKAADSLTTSAKPVGSLSIKKRFAPSVS